MTIPNQQSILQQITNTENSLRLIEERKSQFVEATAIPLDLLRDESAHRDRLRYLYRLLESSVDALADPVDSPGRGNIQPTQPSRLKWRSNSGKIVLAGSIVVIAGLMTVPAWRLYRLDLQMSLRAALEGKPYTIEAVTEIATVSNRTPPRTEDRVITYRYIYTMRPLRPILPTDSAFREEITSHLGSELQYWHGSETEELDHNQRLNKQYEVKFEGALGSTRTIVTGTTQVFDWSSPRMKAQVNGVDLGEDQYALFYANKDDYIGEMLLILTSRGISVSASANSGFRRPGGPGTPMLFKTASTFQSKETGEITISVRWTDIRPGEMVGLRFNW